jgi:hypothetical protein
MTETAQTKQGNTADKPAGGTASRSRVRRFTVPIFLGLLTLMLVNSPLVMIDSRFGLVESVLFTLVLLSAVVAIGAHRRILIWAIVLVAPALIGKWVNHWRPDLMPPEVFLVAAILFLLFVVSQFLRFVLRAPRVNFEVLCAGIAGYLMLGLLWAIVYTLVGLLVPNCFVFSAGHDASHSMQGFTSLYFSFVTLSTVGYGDIIPVSSAARMLAMTEAVVGVFYVTVLIARLVALYSSESFVTKQEKEAN